MADPKKSPLPLDENTFYTPLSFLQNRKESGTIIALADSFAVKGLKVAEDEGCGHDMGSKLSALLRLLQAGYLYTSLLEEKKPMGAREQTKVRECRNRVISAASKLKENIRWCRLKQKHPDIQNVVDLYLDSVKPTGISENDEQVWNRVKATRKTTKDTKCGWRSFEDYAGGEEYKEFFDKIAVTPAQYSQFSNPKKMSGVLLFGPPGTGKTLLAEATASMLSSVGVTLYNVTVSDIQDAFRGNSEKAIKYLFMMARGDTRGMYHGNDPSRRGKVVNGVRPVIIFMDEIDGLLSPGGGSEGGSVLSALNIETAGMEENAGIIFMATTNYPEKIPSAILSRLTFKKYVGLPDPNVIREIIINMFRKFGQARLGFQRVDLDRTKYINIENIDTEPDTLEPVGMKNKEYDSVDLMVSYLWEHNYAPREIDSLIDYMRVEAFFRSKQFLEGRSDRKEQFQVWLIDKTKQTGKNMETCAPEVTHRHAFIPLWWSTDIEGRDKITDPDTVKGKIPYSKEDSKIIEGVTVGVTKREVVDGVYKWQLVRKWQAGEGSEVFNADRASQLAVEERMKMLLGVAQIDMKDFHTAVSTTHPVRIKNAANMLDFANQFPANVSEEDRQFLRQLVSQSEAQEGAKEPMQVLADILSSMHLHNQPPAE